MKYSNPFARSKKKVILIFCGKIVIKYLLHKSIVQKNNINRTSNIRIAKPNSSKIDFAIYIKDLRVKKTMVGGYHNKGDYVLIDFSI